MERETLGKRAKEQRTGERTALPVDLRECADRINVFSIDRREHFSNQAMREMLGFIEEALSPLENGTRFTHPEERASDAKGGKYG